MKQLKLNKLLLFVFICSIAKSGSSQVYTEKQSRHRFAQLNLGFDLHSGLGGSSQYLDAQGITQSLKLGNSFVPRFIIGGNHFWGHADFYIAVPLFSPTFKKDKQEVNALRGVESAFKYYPLRIENKKIRPYIGWAFSTTVFEHQNNNLQYPNGPALSYTNFPLLCGLTFNSKNRLIELGLSWDYQNKRDYYISRTLIAPIHTPPIHASLSYRLMIETTLSAEKDWESGRTKEVTRILAERGRLNGFFAGLGISSAFWLKQSNYNKTNRPYIGTYSASTMPDFSFGYYLHQPDLNIAIAYRGYSTSTNTYGASQGLSRQSLLLEATKYLFDYHGFVPFLGPAISYEDLSFHENFEGNLLVEVRQQKPGYGLTFGWDIRPNRLQAWILRTNLRWYPNLFLDIEPNSNVSFDNLEFNFIQLIIYPNRLIKRKPKSQAPGSTSALH